MNHPAPAVRYFVLRPKDPTKVLAAALAAVGKDKAELDKATAGEEFTFVGYLDAERRAVVDANGVYLGPLEPGDHLRSSLAGTSRVQ